MLSLRKIVKNFRISARALRRAQVENGSNFNWSMREHWYWPSMILSQGTAVGPLLGRTCSFRILEYEVWWQALRKDWRRKFVCAPVDGWWVSTISSQFCIVSDRSLQHQPYTLTMTPARADQAFHHKSNIEGKRELLLRASIMNQPTPSSCETFPSETTEPLIMR